MDYLQSLRSSTHLLRNLQFFGEISHHRSTQSRYGLGAQFGAHPIPGPISKLSQERGKKRRGRGEKREEKGGEIEKSMAHFYSIKNGQILANLAVRC